jgi:hypothetical protein
MKKLGKIWIVSYSSVINTTNFAIFGGKNRQILDITKKFGKYKNGRYQPAKLSRQSVRTNELQGFFFGSLLVSFVVCLRPGESDTNQRNYLVSPDERVAKGIIIVRHSVVRYWSRVSWVSERKKVVPTNETICSVRTD